MCYRLLLNVVKNIYIVIIGISIFTSSSIWILTVNYRQWNGMRSSLQTQTDILEEISCSNVDRIQIERLLHNGWLDYVYLGKYKSHYVTLKMAKYNSSLVQACLVKAVRDIIDFSNKQRFCSGVLTMRLMKEVLLLQKLEHPNIIKLVGFCVRGGDLNSESAINRHDISVFEYGQPFRLDKVLEKPWQTRLSCAVQLASLLVYLENSPIGSVVENDLKPEKFVVVNSVVKLADFDSILATEPTCRNRTMSSLAECDLGIKCVNGICYGHNAKYNLKEFHSSFLRHLLDPSAFPWSLRGDMKEIYSKLETLSIEARSLFLGLDKVLNGYPRECHVH